MKEEVAPPPQGVGSQNINAIPLSEKGDKESKAWDDDNEIQGQKSQNELRTLKVLG